MSFALGLSKVPYARTKWVITEIPDEQVAIGLATVTAKECKRVVYVYEQEPWDKRGDPGTCRWAVHPNGREEALYMGSRQFV